MAYNTRIYEHLNRASEALKLNGKSALTIRDVSNDTGIPYQTVRWYMNTDIANPNYAVVDSIRRYLNHYHVMSSEDYIHLVNDKPSDGETVAVV
jgi:hypothetical protein